MEGKPFLPTYPHMRVVSPPLCGSEELRARGF
jgi:hypothetical protein